MSIVRPERTGWRDQELSKRHRLWGWNCPAVDVDFLMLEYDTSKPVALIEYKHFMAQPVNENHPSIRALRTLADQSGIYAMVVRYWPDIWAFEVTPINDRSLSVYKPQLRLLSEQRYVKSLYVIRGRKADERILETLNTIAPPTEEAA